MFEKVGRSVYVDIDLDAVTNNVNVIRSCCSNKNIGVIGVIKAGAYGHGSVHVGRHLKSIGVERLAVATVDEGMHLRRHDVKGPIHIFGNVQDWEMRACLENALIPTVCCRESLVGMAQLLAEHKNGETPLDINENEDNAHPRPGTVHIKVDTGMSRNGCQPSELPGLIDACEELGVPLEGVFTHFADSWDNLEFTRQQLDTFYKCIEPYRGGSLLFHAANSGAILHGLATELDFVRPGISIYGLSPGDASMRFQACGLKPAASIKGRPTLIKKVAPGTKVGYSCTYEALDEEWVATFPVGYADGYWRHLSAAWFVVRDLTGEKCPVVGRVSMDAITVRLPGEPEKGETFTLMTADYDPHSSAAGVALRVDTIVYEVVTRLSVRYPRLYRTGSQSTVVPALSLDSY